MGCSFFCIRPAMLLLKPDQIELNGNRIVSREAVLQQFVHDRNRSVLRVPLDARRSQLNRFPGWNPPACSASCRIAFASS